MSGGERFRHARRSLRRRPRVVRLGGGGLVLAVLTALVAFVVWPAHASGGLAVDVQVSTHQTGAASTIATPQFTTHSPNELLVAFIASDGPQSGAQSVAAVAGAGLTWTKM